MEVVRNTYIDEFRKNISEYCDKKSREETNLTSVQKRGIQKLSKR